jgi:hypothetical protein
MRMWWLLMLPRDLLCDGCTHMNHCYGIMRYEFVIVIFQK